MIDFGLLLLRVVIGLILAAHGSQKLFGWFGGGGIPGTQKMMRGLNVHPSMFWAYISGLNEFVGGLLLALGFLMPLGPLMLFASMFTAVVRVHAGNGFWNTNRGYEFPLALLVNVVALGFMGAGLYSIDALIHFAAPEPATMIVGMVVVLFGFVISAITGRVTAHERGLSQHSRP